MNEKKKKKISKLLSLVLRHKPKAAGIELDENGWANVELLIKACAKNGKKFTKSELKEVVETNDKKRFSFNDDCLLYTSPSPRDKRQSRMPSSA